MDCLLTMSGVADAYGRHQQTLIDNLGRTFAEEKGIYRLLVISPFPDLLFPISLSNTTSYLVSKRIILSHLKCITISRQNTSHLIQNPLHFQLPSPPSPFPQLPQRGTFPYIKFTIDRRLNYGSL